MQHRLHPVHHALTWVVVCKAGSVCPGEHEVIPQREPWRGHGWRRGLTKGFLSPLYSLQCRGVVPIPRGAGGSPVPGSPMSHFPVRPRSALASGKTPRGWISPFVDRLCQAGLTYWHFFKTPGNSQSLWEFTKTLLAALKQNAVPFN